MPKASRTTTIAAAASPASCERPPVSATTAVRGGLALTGNAPISPDRRLPAPAPMKSRSTSGGSSGLEGKDRVVAAVCTMTTIEMIRLSDTSAGNWPAEISGTPNAGSVADTAPER